MVLLGVISLPAVGAGASNSDVDYSSFYVNTAADWGALAHYQLVQLQELLGLATDLIVILALVLNGPLFLALNGVDFLIIIFMI